ncbi:MAG: UDP-glucose/GDP-mannose dehydrogenase family protein [Candidatus Kerfeldbacteria bacterium]|nr:UDP-glucose/GDP-mannose dehydrogenase family protein [Candidatus Kerfeldbacteria bacterium]
MKITVIGVGYVGLVSSVGLAEMGNDVTCLLRDRNRLKRLQAGDPIIYEPGLAELLRRNLKEGRVGFTVNKERAIRSAELIVIAVGTPQGDDGRADLSAIWQVAKDIGRLLRRRTVIVTKSTVPVGTADGLKRMIRRAMGKRKVAFDVVSNPEFLREGAAVKDFLNPDRVIVGVDNTKTGAVMTELYRSITRAERPVFVTDLRSAELIKYASNCFLATKISFMNEIANFCERVGADVTEVAKGMGFDERIGSRFLHAGLGYGGSCFPKDVSALVHLGRDRDFPFTILEAVSGVNRAQRERVLEKLRQFVPDLKGKTVAVWGLSFKPRTDDVREAPSLDIIGEILEAGGSVRAFDPVAMAQAKAALPRTPRLRYAKDPYDALPGADALLLVTEWDEFRQPDFKRVKKLLKSPVVIDGRNIYNPKQLRKLGFRYASIGRP